MTNTVFTKVDYTLGTLMDLIKLGQIGLPDIQRPFVWNNAKVRDLFDSMYKGYPVGYFLFWRSSESNGNRSIGTEKKQIAPSLVIVDGQQRLTSLYAVIKNINVIRENYESEKILIAFNPIDQKFQVTDAAISKDASYIPNISVLWAQNVNVINIINEYKKNLKSTRELDEELDNSIGDRIIKLQQLLNYPLTALELASTINEESVSDVFVRINGTGTPLNQADFILTLMSVFWDEGRFALEKFCRDCRKPSTGTPSAYNHYIEPLPDQLLRVSVGLAFQRARLKYVYSILRGKDLETEQFSDERRVQQFTILKEAQQKALNLTYWHDFLKCLRLAGFRSGKMISSQTSLIYSYILYLIGKTKFDVSEKNLRKIIAKWFFMSTLTARYSSSPESTMEFDLARLRGIDNGDEFLGILNHICDITLTNDFWNVTLPNDLATSSSRGPSLFAFYAAQVILDAPVLFSKMKISELLDPSTIAPKNNVERHHLFPKAYLEKLGLRSIRDTNQIANFALVEWSDNIDISDNPPTKYLPEIKKGFSDSELRKMYELHAIPENWENMDYQEFLSIRRELMAKIIAKGYASLSIELPREAEELDIQMLVINGESEIVEFKSTLRTNLHTNSRDPRMEHSVLKTIAGFLNTNGGTLIIGVSDDGEPVGLLVDGFESEDKMALHLVNIIKERLGVDAMTNVHINFDTHQETRVLVVECQKSMKPVFLKDEGVEKFYIRTGPSTTELTPSQTQEYTKKRF